MCLSVYLFIFIGTPLKHSSNATPGSCEMVRDLLQLFQLDCHMALHRGAEWEFIWYLCLHHPILFLFPSDFFLPKLLLDDCYHFFGFSLQPLRICVFHDMLSNAALKSFTLNCEPRALNKTCCAPSPTFGKFDGAAYKTTFEKKRRLTVRPSTAYTR